MTRWLRRAALGLAALYLLALGALYAFQRSALYFPRTDRVAPGIAGLAGAQNLTLATQDGETIVAWHRPAAAGKRTILYFHGNGGNLATVAPRLQALSDDGTGVFAIDYRGYGGSSGTTSEEGILLDADAAYVKTLAYAETPGRIVLMGHSLGSGAAVYLAGRHKVAALVLEAPFSSAVDVGAERYPMFPVRWLMRDQFRSDLRIKDVRSPILIVHGADDRTIPIRFGEKLFALAPEPKEFVRLEGVGHLPMLEPGTAPLIKAWLARTAP